jgi:hypothetical protein
MRIFITLASTIILGVLNQLFAQQKLTVAEIAFKLEPKQTTEFLYGFAKNDSIIFTFEEINGLNIESISFGELNASLKFSEHQTDEVDEKIIIAENTGIYKISFTNSADTLKFCRLLLERIPSNNEARNFNPTVYYKKVADTIFTSKKVKYLLRSDTIITNLTDRSTKVHSRGNTNGNRTSFNFTLPANTIAWSYYIGVDQAGQIAFENALRELRTNSVSLFLKYTDYGPLAALALGGASYLSTLKAGEEIDYYIVRKGNEKLFLKNKPFQHIKKGKVINDFSKITNPVKGSYSICLLNDNTVKAVAVMVKVVAVSVNQTWSEKTEKSFELKWREEPYLK